MSPDTDMYGLVRRCLAGLGALVLATGCIGEGDEGGSGSGNSSAARISFETGNEITAPTATRYEQPYTLLVTDADGRPVEGATVTLSVRPLFYFKGAWVPVDTNNDGTADQWGQGYDSNGDGTIDEQPTADTPLNSFRCLSEDRVLQGVDSFGSASFNGSLDTEDTNGNGTLDSGEDINGNGQLDTEDLDGDDRLEPSNDATVSPGTVTTGSNGFADFTLAYPKGNATWSTVQIRARANVEGTEGLATRITGLPVLVDDISDTSTNPPGGSGAGPYGLVGDCTSPD